MADDMDEVVISLIQMGMKQKGANKNLHFPPEEGSEDPKQMFEREILKAKSAEEFNMRKLQPWIE